MSTLSYTSEQLAQRQMMAQLPLLPDTNDSGVQTLSSAQRFGPFSAGDAIIIGSSAPFHVLAGGSGVTANTSSPRFPANLYSMTMPSGCTYVSMIDTVDGAGKGQAYKG